MLLDEALQCVQDSKLDRLQELYAWMHTRDAVYNWEYIFQRLYLKAKSLKRRNIIKWLDELYKKFDDVSKIALRHTMVYAKYIR